MDRRNSSDQFVQLVASARLSDARIIQCTIVNPDYKGSFEELADLLDFVLRHDPELVSPFSRWARDRRHMNCEEVATSPSGVDLVMHQRAITSTRRGPTLVYA